MAWISIAGTVVVTMYAALAYVQIMVLNPMAAVPGESLSRIWAEVSRSQGGFDTITVPVFLVLGPLLAVALSVCALIWLRGRPWTLAASYLGLVALGTPVYVIASFSPGMNLADTYGIDGADYSPWAQPLFITSLAALGVLVVMGVLSLSRTIRGRDNR